MQTNYLFSHRVKKIGWFLFIPGLILGFVLLIYQPDLDLFKVKVFAIAKEDLLKDTISFFTVVENNILDEIVSLLLIIGAIFIAFSKEKIEDELIAKIRLESLVWATYINYIILIVAIIFVYEITFLWALVFNMFTLLFFFLVRFNWTLSKSHNLNSDEE